MNNSEFDRFADEYAATLKSGLSASGEGPEFFAEYKIRDVAAHLAALDLQPRRVLDFGCGVGGSVPHFRRHLPQAALTGIDVSARSLDVARARFPDAADYRLFDGRSLPFDDDTFDVGFAACVFHHIPAGEHIALLAEIRRVLRPGGLFFVFEHNPYNPLTVRVVNNCPFDENAVLIKAAQMRERLAAAGFGRLQTRYRIFFPHALHALRRLEPALAWCPLGAQYYVGARK
jgi:SAM-dependent methyltransferase